MKVIPASKEEIVKLLSEHRTIGQAPRSELEWLADHGELRRYEEGETVVRKGMTIGHANMGMAIVLTGRFAIYVDRGSGPRKVMEWQAGDVSGILPFSRMSISPGDSYATMDVDVFTVNPSCFPQLIRECPTVTGICVHVLAIWQGPLTAPLA